MATLERNLNKAVAKRTGSASREARQTTKKSTAKRERLFDLAARHLNARGIAAISLHDLAAGLGLSRNTLYYYVRDREDLAFQCYRRACLAMSEDLAAAREEGADPGEKIRRFIRASLAFGRPVQAVIAHFDYLPYAERLILQDQIDHNRRNLAALVQRGIDSGHFRACRPDIAADLLVGMLNWARLANDWLKLEDSPEVRWRAITAIEETFLFGVASDPSRPAHCGAKVAGILASITETGEAREERILAEASDQFNARGVEGVALEEIAAALGMSRGAIYHYFESKIDLAVRCYVRAYHMLGAVMDHAATLGTEGHSKITAIFHLNTQLAMTQGAPMRPQPGFSPIAALWKAEAMEVNQPLIAAFTRLFESGIEDGSLRPLDVLFTGAMTYGAIHGLPDLASSYGDDVTPVDVADDLSALLMQGLEKRDSAAAE